MFFLFDAFVQKMRVCPLIKVREFVVLTVYTSWPRPGGAGNLASPTGAARGLPCDCPPRNTAVSVEHHYLTGPHHQLACQTR